MFSKVEFPNTISPIQLDRYLEQGWFRMGQSIFTTNFLSFNQEIYSTLWLRIPLADWLYEQEQQKLVKLNARFKQVIQPAQLDERKELLFYQYKLGVTFETSPSLKALLFGEVEYSVFNTWEIAIYDNDQLIGLGFFDLGKNSAAGISSIFNPAYKKYSLGKFLIYLKMKYTKSLGLQFFYPGYIVPGYSAFDYKLSLSKGEIQYFSVLSNQWMPVEPFGAENVPIQIMRDRLIRVMGLVPGGQHIYMLKQYQYFSANLIPDLKDMDLFEYPLFLHQQQPSGELPNPILVFDVITSKYRILRCFSLWKAEEAHEPRNIFSSHLIKIEVELFATSDVYEVIKAFEKMS